MRAATPLSPLLGQHLHGQPEVLPSTETPLWLQDDEFLYLIMEYLPGGDVMVSGHAACLLTALTAVLDV